MAPRKETDRPRESEVQGRVNKQGKVKGKYNMWKENRMKGALQEYRELERTGNIPNLRYFARAWNVPKSTLQRQVKCFVLLKYCPIA